MKRRSPSCGWRGSPTGSSPPRDVKTTRRREGVATFLLNRVFVVIGALLLVVPHLPLHWLNERFIPPAMAAYFLGLVMVAAGLGFAVWARVYLGRNWSGTVTVKQDHELIRSGPYRLVRHPIYTGLLLAILGTAVGFSEWRGLLAFALFTGSLSAQTASRRTLHERKLPKEYARYRAEVPALIPFIGRARATNNVSG